MCDKGSIDSVEESDIDGLAYFPIPALKHGGWVFYLNYLAQDPLTEKFLD